MRECVECGKQFPAYMRVDGKLRNFSGRKKCLDCSPYVPDPRRAEYGRKGSLAYQQGYAASIRGRYNRKPNTCPTCQTSIPYEDRFRKVYCNSSCAAKYNNKRRKQRRLCIYCGVKEIKRHATRYCSLSCQRQYKLKQRIDEFNSGVNVTYHPNSLRNVLKVIYHNTCRRCGLKEWMGKPITLQIHHKDGNHTNNTKENIDFLCPNCHSQTDNYGAKNKNGTRTYRKKYYKSKAQQINLSLFPRHAPILGESK